MKMFMARQPVFNTDKTVFGYELLFRNGFNNAFPHIDGNEATSNLISNMLIPFDATTVLGGKKGLINFTRELILQKIPLFLPKEHFIIEVLEDIEPERDIINALSLFKQKGFTIALDDFVYHQKFDPMMALCRIIKFDLKQTPLDTLSPVVNEITMNFDITLLAEKIETHKEFEQAWDMGFTLFQGYFFSKPEMMSSTGIAAGQVTKLGLIQEFNKSDMDIENAETLIKNDAAISYKLLKFINSAYFARINPINTIKDAITYIGTDELRKFISVIVMSDLSQGKPNELVRSAIVRAKMCEKLGAILKIDFTKDELFTLGLFSLMDAMLDCEMEDILEHINFSDKMKDAMLGKNGHFNRILKIIETIDRGRWNSQFFKIISGKKIETTLPDIYLDSVNMANSFA